MYNRKIYRLKGTVYTVPFSQAEQVCSLRKIEVETFLIVLNYNLNPTKP